MKQGKQFRIPAKTVDVKKHGPGSIGIIGYMNLPFGQVIDQPAIHRTKQKFPFLCPFPCLRYMVKDPLNLRCTKISIRNQSGLCPYHIAISGTNQFIHSLRRPPALPHDPMIYRLPGLLIPHNSSLSLIGDSNSSDILRGGAHLCHCFRCNRKLGRPDLHRIVLNPSRLRIDLCKFLLRHT